MSCFSVVVRLVGEVILDTWFILFILFCVVFAFAMALHLLYRDTEAAGAAFASLDVSVLSVFTWIFYAFDQVRAPSGWFDEELKPHRLK